MYNKTNLNRNAVLMLALLFALAFISTVSTASAVPAAKLEFSQGVMKTDLPSASGMIYKDGHYYVAGDDSPYLFKLDQKFNVSSRLLLKDYPVDQNGRILKSDKPDFEAIENFKWKDDEWLLIIGSGSKAIKREVAFLVSDDGKKKQEKNMAPFYKQLGTAAGFGVDELINLEGLCVTKDRFLFVNRCNAVANIIFSVSKKEFMNYLQGQTTTVNDIKAYRLQLPKIDGYLAGLSGAEYIEKTGELLLTASVEVTGDPINDGKILGSFIGVMPLKDLKNNMDATGFFSLLESEGKPYVTKVESIAVQFAGKNRIEGAIASDNDDGTSVFHNYVIKLR
ncbi:MAG: hypothetical protein N2645_14140 [Clostridia bacterium]|nr:hypothetical protein [Clostridia bacterium]